MRYAKYARDIRYDVAGILACSRRSLSGRNSSVTRIDAVAGHPGKVCGWCGTRVVAGMGPIRLVAISSNHPATTGKGILWHRGGK